MTVKEALDIFVKQHIVVVLKTAKVTAVDKDKCTVDLDMITEVEMTDVRLQAGIVETAPGIKVIPKIGSIVTVGMLENNTAIGIILGYTEIEEIELNPLTSAKICGDNLGGLVISAKVNEQINELKTQVNKISVALNAMVIGTPDPSPGATSLKAAVTAAGLTQLQPKQNTYFENPKAKHGN